MASKIEIIPAKNGYVVLLTDRMDAIEPVVMVATSVDDALKLARQLLNLDDVTVPRPPHDPDLDDDGAEAV